MSNSRVIARGKAECYFDCCEYNYSLIAHKYMRLPTNHIARPMTLYSYPQDRREFQLRLTYQSCSTNIVLYSRSTFIKLRKTIFIHSKRLYRPQKVPDYTHFSVLLPYLSVTKHFTQYQCDATSFADYYVVACCT